MITDYYKKQLELMAGKKAFKEKCNSYDEIKEFVLNKNPQSILDFGCARGNLINLLKKDFPNIIIEGYDPGIDEFSILPSGQYECLISNDVLEHVEIKYLEETLKTIDNYFTDSAWIIIACYPAKKILPDGRNAHLIIKSPIWWMNKISKIMKQSKIKKSEIVVKNPESDILDKVTKDIIVPQSKQIELRLILEK